MTPLPLQHNDHGECADGHESVHEQVERHALHAGHKALRARCRRYDAQQDVSHVRNRGVGQHALDIGLRDRGEVADRERRDGHAATSISQSRRTGQKTVSSSRSSSAKLAVLLATLMYAVIGVGAPSYTSGAHWWNGTAAILKNIPEITVTSARNTNISKYVWPGVSTIVWMATWITSRLVRGGRLPP